MTANEQHQRILYDISTALNNKKVTANEVKSLVKKCISELKSVEYKPVKYNLDYDSTRKNALYFLEGSSETLLHFQTPDIVGMEMSLHITPCIGLAAVTEEVLVVYK